MQRKKTQSKSFNDGENGVKIKKSKWIENGYKVDKSF